MRGKNWEGVWYIIALWIMFYNVPADLFYKQPLSDPLSDMKTEYDPRTATILGHEAQLSPLLCHVISIIHQEHDMISSQQYLFLLSIFGANLINNV